VYERVLADLAAIRFERDEDMRPEASGSWENKEVAADDPEFAAALPLLWEHVSCLRWEDGKPRQTSTMTLFVEAGRCKLCLHDREMDRTAWVSAETLRGAAEILERQLRTGAVEWRGNRKGRH